MSQPSQRSPLDAIVQAAARLPRPLLLELQAAIAGLVEATEPERAQSSKRKRDSSIEWKFHLDFSGHQVYGPFPYLRYWVGDRVRNRFLKGYRGKIPKSVLDKLERLRERIEGKAAQHDRHVTGIAPGMEVEIAPCSAYGNRYAGCRGVVLDVIPEPENDDEGDGIMSLARVALSGASTDYVFRQDALIPVMSPVAAS